MSDYANDQVSRFSNLELDDAPPAQAPVAPSPIVRGVTVDACRQALAVGGCGRDGAVGFKKSAPGSGSKRSWTLLDFAASARSYIAA